MGLPVSVMEAILPFSEHAALWIYEHPLGDGVLEVLALVLAKRPNGLLVAVPPGVFSDEELAAAHHAQMDDIVGSSLPSEAPALAGVAGEFTPVPDLSVPAIVVDLSIEAVPRFSQAVPGAFPELVVPFDNSRPELLPDPGVLLQLALDWAAAAGAPERLQYYSAEEEPAEPVPKPKRPVLRLSKGDALPQAASALPSGGVQPKQPAPKKVTTATLALQLETLTSALPGLVRSMEDLATKQAAMEKQMAGGPAAPLSQPLGLGIQAKIGGPPALGLLGPPPRTSRQNPQPQLPAMGQTGLAETTAEEAREELGLPPASDSLSQAVLEQSRALTALVAQLAGSSGDLLSEASGSLSQLSARGAGQRAKMQEELASDRGTFFLAVLQNMARRMAPAVSPSSDPSELMQQGVCLSRYWERFGGFAGQRDLGAIAHALAHAMDSLQAGRVNQASDHLALLAVCIEQMSMDGGRAELGYQLTWLEDPPSAMFAARPGKSTIHTRAFAPLAAQRWVAIVLSYVKELDVIATKRADMKRGGPPSGGGSGAPEGDNDEAPSSSRPRRPPRKKQGQ